MIELEIPVKNGNVKVGDRVSWMGFQKSKHERQRYGKVRAISQAKVSRYVSYKERKKRNVEYVFEDIIRTKITVVPDNEDSYSSPVTLTVFEKVEKIT